MIDVAGLGPKTKSEMQIKIGRVVTIGIIGTTETSREIEIINREAKRGMVAVVEEILTITENLRKIKNAMVTIVNTEVLAVTEGKKRRKLSLLERKRK